jgi:hypothetical protein
VFLGLRIRPVGDEHLTCGLQPQRPRAAFRLQAANKTLTPAAFISSLSAPISRPIASSSETAGS